MAVLLCHWARRYSGNSDNRLRWRGFGLSFYHCFVTWHAYRLALDSHIAGWVRLRIAVIDTQRP